MTADIKLAKLIRIEYCGDSFRFEVDGERFPWAVSSEGLTVRLEPRGGRAHPGVTFTLAADRVEVVHDLYATPEPPDVGVTP